MTMVAHCHPYVVGVDTHARSHALAVVSTATGQRLGGEQFPATSTGMARAIAWAGRRTGGDLQTLWVIEGVGTYGARLAHAAAEAGYEVVEAARMNARANRAVGKSDPLDAHRIGTAVLPLETSTLRHPRKDDGVRAAVRVLVTARENMTTERTTTVNALIALVRTVDLGIDARRPLSTKQIIEISRWRAREEAVAAATARNEAVRLAKRVVAIGEELTTNQADMTDLVNASEAAPLLDKTGIGPVTAAVALTTWSHHGRVRSEAAFASLAGVSPIPASSGNTVRHRLNRGGVDRHVR